MEYLTKFYSYVENPMKYDYTKRRYVPGDQPVTKVIPETINGYTLQFPMGYIFSFSNLMYQKIDPLDLSMITAHFTNKDFKITNYGNLEDLDGTYKLVDNLLKLKRGILQRPTGKGKTEIIVTIVANAINQGMKVLLVTENKSAYDELRSRLQSRGISLPKYFDVNSNVNIVKTSGFCRSNYYNDVARKWLSEVNMLIGEEVETTPNSSFQSMFTYMTGVEYVYGFSATSNKVTKGGIPKDASLTNSLNSSVHGVISYYGFSNRDIKPKGYKIDVTLIRTFMVVHPDISIQAKVTKKVLSSWEFYNSVHYILENTGNDPLFIPVNATEVFDNLIKDSNFFTGPILMISGNGYQLFDKNEFIRNVSYDESKELIQNKEVRIILGTSSSYRAFDTVGILSVLILFEKQDALLKQIIGRLTRNPEFRIFLLDNKEYVPFLNFAKNSNLEEIKSYYSDCTLTINRVYHNKPTKSYNTINPPNNV